MATLQNLCLHSGDFGAPYLCAGNMGILRCDMPQMPDSADLLSGAAPFSKWLKQLMIQVVLTSLPPGQLKATQQELQQDKVMGMVDSAKAGKFQPWSTPDGKGSVQVTQDGYILDGHHRWAATTILIQQGFIPASTLMNVLAYVGAPGTRPMSVANLLAIANIAGDAGGIGHSKCPAYEGEPWDPSVTRAMRFGAPTYYCRR